MSIPDFLILGAAKSGTTTLIYELKNHPDVFTPGSELNYFTQQFTKGAEWYNSIFKFPEKVQGEKSTSYFYEKPCHERIFKHNPEMKLIVLLREPVKRAFSNWNMRHVQGRLLKQAYKFNKSTGQPIENIGFSHLFKYYLACDSEVNRHLEPLDIFERGLYIDQILHLLKFFHREQLLVLIAEDYFKNPVVAMEKVSQHLDICAFPKGGNLWVRKSDYPIKLDDKVAFEIHQYYKPYNERFFDFLGFEIPDWKW
jgi:hypothetical protein